MILKTIIPSLIIFFVFISVNILCNYINKFEISGYQLNTIKDIYKDGNQELKNFIQEKYINDNYISNEEYDEIIRKHDRYYFIQ